MRSDNIINNKYSENEAKSILNSLGYRLRDDGDSWRTSAIFRGGKNEGSLKIYKNTGVWHDYGANSKSQPFSELLKLSGYKGENIISDKNEIIIDKKDIPERIYPDSILNRLLPHYRFYVDKGIDIATLKRLKSGLAMSGKMYQRYIFPIFDDLNRIVGFAGRYLGIEDRPKWKIIGKKRNWCYPLNIKDELGQQFVKDSILKYKEVYIVESIGDMLSFHTRGIYNVIVSFGLDISPKIVSSLLSLDIDRIFICFNNDDNKDINNGLDAAIQEVLNLLVYFDCERVGICLPIKNDFGDMNGADFKIWDDKRLSLDYKLQREKICEQAEKLLLEKRITKKSYDNIKYLGC